MHDTMESPANHCCCVTFLSGCHPQRGEKLSSCEFLLVTGSPIQQGGPQKARVMNEVYLAPFTTIGSGSTLQGQGMVYIRVPTILLIDKIDV